MSLLRDLQVRELTAPEIPALVSAYAGQPASRDLDPVRWTKETLALDLLQKAPPDTRFFLLSWYGYTVPMDVEIGGVTISNTSGGDMSGKREGGGLFPKRVGSYVRLEGEGFEGNDQHLMLVFLNPQS